MKFRKKPVVIDAVQITDELLDNVMEEALFSVASSARAMAGRG